MPPDIITLRWPDGHTEARTWRSPGDAVRAVEAMARYNVGLIRAGRVPPLHASGARYVPEDGSEELWSADAVWQAGGGDCEDLAAWRLAELYVAGVRARPEVVRVGPSEWHVVVKLPDGRFEDPSEELSR